MKKQKSISWLGLFLVAFVSISAHAMNVRREGARAAGTKTQIKMEVNVGAGGATALDILFVVDDSGSMAEHQANLLANVGDLVRASLASGVSIHAGVITTNMDTAPWTPKPGQPWRGELGGVKKKFASSDDGDFETVLTENLQAAMTTNGSGIEQPFLAVRTALSEPLVSGVNKGFLRESAALAVFVLTDADDQSPAPVSEFITFLKDLKKKTAVTLHAAYIPAAVTTCNRSGEAEPKRLEEVLTTVGTLKESFSVCDKFGAGLTKIGEGYEVLGVSTVQLKVAPELSTMKVNFGTTMLEAGDLLNGWVYDSSKLQLQFGRKIDWNEQPSGTPLKIEYFAK